MKEFKPTKYILETVATGRRFEDGGWTLADPECKEPSLVRAIYEKKQIEFGPEERGIYKFADWMPVRRMLKGSAATVTYKSEKLGAKLGLPNLYIAYDPNRAEISGTYHRKLKVLFEEKKPDILAAMTEFADIAQQGRDALVAGDFAKLPDLVNANFDLRDRIFHVSDANRNMVMTARRSGASAKFAGSGGAIVGTYGDEAQYARLAEDLKSIGCSVLRPTVAG